MFCYRITKYDPLNRDSLGTYIKDEWTSFSDIGKIFEDSIFTIQDYQQVEDVYIQSILLFMDCLNLNQLCITSLQKNSKPLENSLSSSIMTDVYNSLKNGKFISRKLINIIARLALRENLWCKLETEKMYVHFGYDYYMYIGSQEDCIATVKKIEKLGLFIEPYKSPHL